MTEEITPTPNPLQPNGFGGVQSDAGERVPWHNHDGINSPKLGGGAAGNEQNVQYKKNGQLAGSDSFLFDENSEGSGYAAVQIGDPLSRFLRIDLSQGDGIDFLTDEFAEGNGIEGTDITFTAGDGDSDDVQEGGAIRHFAGATGIANGASMILRGGSWQGSLEGGTAVVEAGGAGVDGGGGGDVINISGDSTDSDAGSVEESLGTGNATTGKDGVHKIVGQRQQTHANTGSRSPSGGKRISGVTITTDDSATNIHRSLVPDISSNFSMLIEARVTARRVSGSSGSAGDSAMYVRRAGYKNIAGTVTLVGAVQDVFTVEDQAGWDCTFVISGTEVFLQVTGATDNNVVWQFELFYIISG